MSELKVSVLVPTYNHEKFITQAIESALMQHTTFEYEIVIGEDCSTDRTGEIVREFQRRCPERIVVLSAEFNVGATPNFVRLFSKCRGEYVALLEGDDFWTSPDKLQKQVDFLDRHPDYTVVFHNIRDFYDGCEENGWNHCPCNQKKTLTVNDLLRANPIGTPSVMFRRQSLGELPQWCYKVSVVDWAIHVLNALQGKVGYLDEVMAAYRIHRGGMFSKRRLSSQLEAYLRFYDCLAQHLGPAYREVIEAARFRVLYSLFVAYIQEDRLEESKTYASKCLHHKPIYKYFGTRLKVLMRLYAPVLFSFGSRGWRFVKLFNIPDRTNT